jgi:hypothetical protein
MTTWETALLRAPIPGVIILKSVLGYIFIYFFPEASLLGSIMSWLDPAQRLWDHLVSRIVYFQRLGRKSICYGKEKADFFT